MKVIEFMGMPRTGKSTQFQLMETVLRYQEHKRVRCLYEAAQSCPLDKADRFHYSSWIIHHTVNRLIEAKTQDTDFILVERGIWDQIAFSLALYFSGKLTKRQYLTQKRYCEQFGSLEDTVLAFMIDPETSVKREQKYHQLRGLVTNERFLSCLYGAYTKIMKGVKQSCYLIDSSKPLKVNSEEILGYILD